MHYPSIKHFCDMAAGEDYQEINKKHRLDVSHRPSMSMDIALMAKQALADTILLCTTELELEQGNARAKL